MKFSTVLSLLSYAFAAEANLVPRQGCSEDNCFRAVWGTNLGTDHPLTAQRDCMSRLTTTVAIFPITTITVLARDTVTTVISCSTTSTSSTASSLSASASSLPEFTFPTPTPTSTGSAAGRVQARQNQVLSSSTTTIIGPIPTYVGNACSGLDSLYASTCSCKGVTQSTLLSLGTTLTSTDTSTSTSTVTSTASCSTSYTITLSYSSSTTVTTVTIGSSTGTGTGSVSSTSSSSSSSITDTSTISSTSVSTSFTPSNTTIIPSTTLSTRSTSWNTTLTSSTTSTYPTPICSGLGSISCNGTCHVATNDRLNCGRCGNACASGLDCINGVCARQPCDSTCDFDRYCNSGPNRPSGGCICATDASQHGICFDKDRYQCGNENLVRCLQTELSSDPSKLGCPLGHVCIKSICASNCNSTGVPEAAQLGICVSTERCGDSGTTQLGPLLKIGEQEKRRRLIGEFNW